MSATLIGLVVAFLTAIFTSLLTYFITTTSQKGTFQKNIKTGAGEALENHIMIHHKKDINEFVDAEVEKVRQELKLFVVDKIQMQNEKISLGMDAMHEVSADMKRFRLAMHWMIMQMKGKPTDFGL